MLILSTPIGWIFSKDNQNASNETIGPPCFAHILAEWPDAELKSCPIFPNVAQKSNHNSLTWNVLLLTLAIQFT